MTLKLPFPCRFRCPTRELAIEALKVLEKIGVVCNGGGKPTSLSDRNIYSLHLNEHGYLLYSHSINGWDYQEPITTTISINDVLRLSTNKATTVSVNILDLF